MYVETWRGHKTKEKGRERERQRLEGVEEYPFVWKPGEDIRQRRREERDAKTGRS